MLPVKATLSTPSCFTRCSPTSRPAGTKFTTPAGSPASCTSSARITASRGVSGAGFTTTVAPAASAGPSFSMIVKSGTFQGTMAAATPTGSWRTSDGPMRPVRTSSKGNSRVRFT